MGDQFVPDLTRAFKDVAVSRKRALQLIGAAVAVTAPTRLPQVAEARKRRKRPLAFVGATVTINAASSTSFTWQISGAVAHPDSNFATTFTSNRGVAANLPADKVRADIVAHLKTYAASLLTNVPVDRIAVTLL